MPSTLGRLAAALAGQRRMLASITTPHLHLAAQSRALAGACAQGWVGADPACPYRTTLARTVVGPGTVERSVLGGSYLVPSD